MGRFTRSTVVVTALTAGGLGLGFWANVLTASRFGVGPAMDAYLAATTLPSLISLILTTSLAAVFLPVFTAYRQKDPAEAWKVAGGVTTAVGAAGLVACLAGMALAEPLARGMTPGLDPAGAALAAGMLRWLLPTVALSAVNQVFAGSFYAEGRFAAPLMIRVISPLFTIAYVTAFSETLEVRALALATLSAHAVQTLLLAGLLAARRGAIPTLPDWRHPGVRKVFRLGGPLVLGMCFYKLGPAYERWLASGMGAGAISTLGYATRLTSALQPLLVSGIALSGFALMADQAAKKDMAALRATLSNGCGALFFASMPLAVLLCGFAGPVTALLFERGAFSPQDTAATARLFAIYALGLPAGAVGTLIGQAFYALQDTRLPVLAGLLDLALFIALSALLVPHWGLAALPAGFVAALYATSLLITGRLSRRVGFSVWALLARPFLRSLAAALAALALATAMQGWLPASRGGSMAGLAAGIAAYLAIQRFAFKSPEIARALRLLGPGRAAR